MAGGSTPVILCVAFHNPLDSLPVSGSGVAVPDCDAFSQDTLSDAAVEVHKQTNIECTPGIYCWPSNIHPVHSPLTTKSLLMGLAFVIFSWHG